MTTRDRLIRRLSWYYPTELCNAIVFTGIFLFVLYKYDLRQVLFLAYGLFIMTLILYQGQFYWKLKLYRLKGIAIDENRELKRFRYFKKLNQILIGLIPVVFSIQWVANNLKLIPENYLGWAIACNLFAVLEHINYFHLQLMIDNRYDVAYLAKNRKLKEASLAKDLRENRI